MSNEEDDDGDEGGWWRAVAGATILRCPVPRIGRSAPAPHHKTKPKKKAIERFSPWPSNLMPATTYSPTHFRVQYNRPGGA